MVKIIGRIAFIFIFSMTQIFASLPSKVSDKNSQKQFVEIIDYFSKNYPYSQMQFEKYFHVKLKKSLSEDLSTNSANKKQIWRMPKANHSIIDEIALNTTKNSQTLDITMRNPVCYPNSFIDELFDKDYMFFLEPFSSLSGFVTIMDKQKNTGTLILRAELNENSNEKMICFNELVFYPKQKFNKDNDNLVILNKDEFHSKF